MRMTSFSPLSSTSAGHVKVRQWAKTGWGQTLGPPRSASSLSGICASKRYRAIASQTRVPLCMACVCSMLQQHQIIIVTVFAGMVKHVGLILTSLCASCPVSCEWLGCHCSEWVSVSGSPGFPAATVTGQAAACTQLPCPCLDGWR